MPQRLLFASPVLSIRYVKDGQCVLQDNGAKSSQGLL